MSRISPFKFDLAGTPPQVVAQGGTIQEQRRLEPLRLVAGERDLLDLLPIIRARKAAG